eukprot:m.80332 g.80332  ORF g.80332 m.80332 type:complete len:961 (+) comp12752_c0_seq3:321-3203(+)
MSGQFLVLVRFPVHDSLSIVPPAAQIVSRVSGNQDDVYDGMGAYKLVAKLSHRSEEDVRIQITYTGTAQQGVHFTGPTSVLIPAGELYQDLGLNILYAEIPSDSLIDKIDGPSSVPFQSAESSASLPVPLEPKSTLPESQIDQIQVADSDTIIPANTTTSLDSQYTFPAAPPKLPTLEIKLSGISHGIIDEKASSFSLTIKDAWDQKPKVALVPAISSQNGKSSLEIMVSLNHLYRKDLQVFLDILATSDAPHIEPLKEFIVVPTGTKQVKVKVLHFDPKESIHGTVSVKVLNVVCNESKLQTGLASVAIDLEELSKSEKHKEKELQRLKELDGVDKATDVVTQRPSSFRTEDATTDLASNDGILAVEKPTEDNSKLEAFMNLARESAISRDFNPAIAFYHKALIELEESNTKLSGNLGRKLRRELEAVYAEMEQQASPNASRTPILHRFQTVLRVHGIEDIAYTNLDTQRNDDKLETRMMQASFTISGGRSLDRLVADILGLEAKEGQVRVWVVELLVKYPAVSGNVQKREQERVRAFEEMKSSVKSMAEITFDYVALILCAAFIAALGLGRGDVVATVASMLISPLMGPILGTTFALVTLYEAKITLVSVRKDLSSATLATGKQFAANEEQFYTKAIDEALLLAKISVRSELLGLFLCMLVGFIIGLVFSPVQGEWGWPTEFMTSRGDPMSLAVGLGIAVPSGVGVAISVTAGNAGGLVGVAISASLLPPAVNAGMLWGLALPSKTDRYELFRMGGYSLLLTLVNILSIIIISFVTFRLKSLVDPRDRRSKVAVREGGHIKFENVSQTLQRGTKEQENLHAALNMEQSSKTIQRRNSVLLSNIRERHQESVAKASMHKEKTPGSGELGELKQQFKNIYEQRKSEGGLVHEGQGKQTRKPWFESMFVNPKEERTQMFSIAERFESESKRLQEPPKPEVRHRQKTLFRWGSQRKQRNTEV